MSDFVERSREVSEGRKANVHMSIMTPAVGLASKESSGEGATAL